MSISRGTIVSVIFPFTDFSGEKRRPALVVGGSTEHAVVLFITSKQTGAVEWRVTLPKTKATGLKVPSAVRIDKIASIDISVLAGTLGSVPESTLTTIDKRLKKLLGL